MREFDFLIIQLFMGQAYNTQFIMGIICQKKENLNNYTPQFKNQGGGIEDFKFITKKLNTVQAQCLLLFVDTQCNVRKNEFLGQIDQIVGSKLQDHLDIELMGKCMNPGDCLILDVNINQFMFKHVAILCVNIWTGGDVKLQQPLAEDLQDALTAIKQKNIKTVCITTLNTQLGIPYQVGNKALGRAAMQKRSQFEEILFFCQTQEKKVALTEVMEQQINKKEELIRKSRQSLGQSQKSDYY